MVKVQVPQVRRVSQVRRAWRVSGWWHARSNPQRFDVAIRWPLYLMSATEPLLALLIVIGQAQVRWPAAIAFLFVSVLHTVACMWLLRTGLDSYLGGPRPGRRVVALVVGLGFVAVLTAAAAFPTFAQPTVGNAFPVSLAVVMLASGAVLAALTPVLRSPVLLGVILAAAVTATGFTAVIAPDSGDGGSPLAGAFAFYVWAVGLAVATYRLSTWMLGIVWELDRSRAAHASLAVAEERLRFARDLHDTLGRNLSLVAVQSELAARLAQRGDAAAVERMLDVRQIAHDSLREMRAVVGGYRTADLGSELAGARAVLRSAGVSCRVVGDGNHLPATAQTALGWVVREATTNVIRHSDATLCTIDLEITDGPSAGGTVVMRMANDGVPSQAVAAGAELGSGTGLAGLGERLAGLGGTLRAQAERGGRFVVTVRLPMPDEAGGDATGHWAVVGQAGTAAAVETVTAVETAT